MTRTRTLIVAAAVLAVAGCQQVDHGPWFSGDFEAAKAAATARDTLVVLDFYSET